VIILIHYKSHRVLSLKKNHVLALYSDAATVYRNLQGYGKQTNKPKSKTVITRGTYLSLGSQIQEKYFDKINASSALERP